MNDFSERTYDTVFKPCFRYAPGHRAHYLQARLAFEKSDQRRTVTITNVEGHYVTVRFEDGSVEVWRFDDGSHFLLPWLYDPEVQGFLYYNNLFQLAGRDTCFYPCRPGATWSDCEIQED
jgi:hypothetical protein